MGIKVGLHIIVKGEQDRIASCIASNHGLADYYSIAVDSGSSSDKTYEICRNIVGPKDVFRHEWKDDFAEARNSALNHLLKTHPDVDYVYWIDSDDLWDFSTISPQDIKSRIEELSPIAIKNLYYYGFNPSSKESNLSYYRVRMWKCIDGKSTRHWAGPAHEVNIYYPEYEGSSEATWDDFILIHTKDGHESHREGRTNRNIKALKKGLRDEPNHPRYLFYLAREYKDAGELDNSLESYEKYLPVTFFVNEKYQALLDMSYIYRVKSDTDNALKYAKLAWELKPEIAEAAVVIGELYSHQNNWGMAKPWFAYAANAPHGEVLFDHTEYRTLLPYRWLAVSNYYTDNLERARYYQGKARSINPHDYLTKSNDVWMFHNDYTLADPKIISMLTNLIPDDGQVNFDNYVTNLWLTIASKLKENSCGNYVQYLSDLSIYDHKALVDQLDLDSELIPKIFNPSEYVFFPQLISLNSSDNSYPDYVIDNIVPVLLLGGMLAINNFQDSQVKLFLSSLFSKFNFLTPVFTIDQSDNSQMLIIMRI